jgi:hypothetical protein
LFLLLFFSSPPIMRFVLSALCFMLLSVAGVVSAQDDFTAAPSKLSLGTQFMNLPGIEQPQPTLFAQPAPVKSLPMQTLPSKTLPAQQGGTLQTQSLPWIRTQTSETLPEQTLEPLQPQFLQPNYRTQTINQEVIQPVVKTQPVLQVRHVTQNVYQPTLQKQPVIQRVITQPILHRVIHNQPIVQQQLQQQTVVKRRVIAQPRVVQRLQMQYQTAPQQTQTEFGAQYPTQTIPNAKVAQFQQYQAAADAPADDMNTADEPEPAAEE